MRARLPYLEPRKLVPSAMKPAMYIFVNKGLGMSPGKIAAQAGHAAVEATLLSHPITAAAAPGDAVNELWNAWRTGLHYAKYVMEARDSDHLRDTERYLNDRGFKTALIIDEGHTEIEPIQPTALGVALVDKDDPHTAATFESFKLFRQQSPEQAYVLGCADSQKFYEKPKRRWWNRNVDWSKTT